MSDGKAISSPLLEDYLHPSPIFTPPHPRCSPMSTSQPHTREYALMSRAEYSLPRFATTGAPCPPVARSKVWTNDDRRLVQIVMLITLRMSSILLVKMNTDLRTATPAVSSRSLVPSPSGLSSHRMAKADRMCECATQITSDGPSAELFSINCFLMFAIRRSTRMATSVGDL